MTDDDVVITWRTPGVICASVRDDRGVVDVRWSGSTGWSCSCGDLACHHIEAVRQTTRAAN